MGDEEGVMQMSDRTEIAQKNSSDDIIVSDVTIVSEHEDEQAAAVVTEDVEQISKSVAIGRKEAYYEDGRNVISVIINAISVRINMPRGTVKALMACFVALIIAAGAFGLSRTPANSEDTDKAGDTVQSSEQTEDTADTAADTKTDDGVLALKDYINISPHYYYHQPDNVKDIWTPDELYAENETLCDFTYNGHLYTVRSYMLDYSDNELADIVKADLNLFDDMHITGEDYIEGKYGDILKISFETTEDDGSPVVGNGYYWYEMDPKICCLEVTSDARYDEGTEKLVVDSVYRVSSGSTAPYMIDSDAYDEAMKEEALNSLQEDAMRDYYDEQNKPDYTDRVLKP